MTKEIKTDNTVILLIALYKEKAKNAKLKQQTIHDKKIESFVAGECYAYNEIVADLRSLLPVIEVEAD